MEYNWLKKIKENLQILSKENWLTELYESAKKHTLEEGFGEGDEYYEDFVLSFFNLKIDEFEESILFDYFEHLNYSILSGECFHPDFLKTLKETINLCGAIQYSPLDDSIDENIRLSLEDAVQEKNPLSILKDCLIEYLSNAKHLLRHIENPSLNTLFDLSDQTQDILDRLKSNNGSEIQKELLKLIKNNFFLLRKDFVLKYEVNELQDLLISKNELLDCNKFFKASPNSSISTVIPILIEKSIFLIRKFIIRKSREKDMHNENYVFLGKETDFDLKSHQLTKDIFNDWDEYSINHFLSEENAEKEFALRRGAKNILKIGKVTALDFHSLTKYFKDLEKDLTNLNNLSSETENIPINSENYFDKYSIDVIKNYISNNIFSEKLNSFSLSTTTKINDIASIIDEDLKQIQILQRGSSINNFFPYFKICDFLYNYIEKKISISSLENNNSKNYINEASVALDFLKNYFESFKLNLKWSKAHLNYAYQLPFSECIKNHQEGGKKIQIFCSSTFSLPIDFKKFDDFKITLAAFILRIENDIKSLSNITSLMEIYGGEKDKLQNEIKDNFKKNIELLGIFSAIIALIFGGISTITKNIKFEDQFLILITLFIILFTFITLLKTYVNKDKERDVFQVLGLFFVYLIFLIAIIAILSLVLKLR